MDTVRSLTTVRVMVLSRAAWESLERHFPLASRLVLENLKRRAERAVADEFPGVCPNTPAFQQLLSSCPGTMMYSWASPELVRRKGGGGGAAHKGARGGGYQQAGGALRGTCVAARACVGLRKHQRKQFVWVLAKLLMVAAAGWCCYYPCSCLL
jgi:hypothetical protein